MIPLQENPLYACSMDLWDVAIMRSIRYSHNDTPTALDIGANDGGVTYTLLNKGFEVHSFEPVPDMFDNLSRRYRFNPNVRCHRLALSDAPGELKGIQVHVAWTLVVPGATKLSVCPAYEGRPPFDVDVDTVDSYVEKTKICVDFIKLDVDGYEPKVLRGAEETISKFQPPIMCELSCWPERIGENPQRFIEHIFSLGYAIYSMDGKNKFTTWKEVEPCYPHDESFDVMLIPKKMNL